MTSFAKHIAVLMAALIATTALAEKSDDGKPAKSEKEKSKKGKNAKSAEDPNAAQKTVDVPVVKGHDSKGLHIPYFDSSGKHEMDFTIGVASRLDENHIQMKDLSVETFNDDGGHEMQIDLPLSTLDTNTSAISTRTHVVIRRADFELTGDAMIFYTKTKQGGLAGNVHMLIYNLNGDAADTDKPGDEKEPAPASKSTSEADSFKTPQSRDADSTSPSKEKPDKFFTPGSK